MSADGSAEQHLAADRPGPGVVLSGRYRLIASLGSGATAEVWRAHDTRLARDVAVKIFDERRVLADGADRRMAEMRLLAGASGPGIVTIYDAQSPMDSTGGLSFLVMELVDGQTLARHLDRGPLSAAATADIGAQLAETLAHVHERRVVHRDIKPANILLARAETGFRVKLSDFGIAVLLGDARLTADGLTVGTANYLSPEQATGRAVGPACDVYALGLVLIECLTGVVAYPGYGIEAAIARLHRPPRLPDTMPAAWRELLVSMTAYSPQDRPATTEVARTLRDLRTALTTDALADAAGAAAPAGTASTTSLVSVPATALLAAQGDAHSRRRALWLGASAGAAGLAALLVVASTSGNSPAAPQTPAGTTEQAPLDADANSTPPTSSAAAPSSAAASPSATRPRLAASTTVRSRHAVLMNGTAASARTVDRTAPGKNAAPPAKHLPRPAKKAAPPRGKKP